MTDIPGRMKEIRETFEQSPDTYQNALAFVDAISSLADEGDREL